MFFDYFCLFNLFWPWSSKEEVKEGFLISLDYVNKHNLTFFQGYFSLMWKLTLGELSSVFTIWPYIKTGLTQTFLYLWTMEQICLGMKDIAPMPCFLLY